MLQLWDAPNARTHYGAVYALALGSNYGAFSLAFAASLAGLPAISVPAGVSQQDGWPLGVQIVGQWGSDKIVLRIAQALENLAEKRDR